MGLKNALRASAQLFRRLNENRYKRAILEVAAGERGLDRALARVEPVEGAVELDLVAIRSDLPCRLVMVCILAKHCGLRVHPHDLVALRSRTALCTCPSARRGSRLTSPS